MDPNMFWKPLYGLLKSTNQGHCTGFNANVKKRTCKPSRSPTGTNSAHHRTTMLNAEAFTRWLKVKSSHGDEQSLQRTHEADESRRRWNASWASTEASAPLKMKMTETFLKLIKHKHQASIACSTFYFFSNIWGSSVAPSTPSTHRTLASSTLR